jgi:serine/threonine protein kinase
MKLPDTTQARLENQERAREGAEPNEGASFFVHLWAYGGAKQQLSGLTLDSEPDVAELVFNFLTEAHGQVTERWPKGLVARFDHPLFALSAAKQLQQRLLTFHRPGSPEQVVASILISGRKNHAGSADHAEVVATAQMLLDGKYSAQILVSEAIYELAQNARGFHFNSKPVRAAGDSGASETIYELLWTDESTYGHLREAGNSIGIHTAGRYQIQSELGRGAMGIVYKAYDQVIARTVALKTISIDRNAPNRRELIERLKQEAKAAGGLDHPNIITIYDVGQEDDLVYLSMQFLEGKTLLTLLAEGDLPALPTLISYAEQICSAVGFAHARGVIHRDLKPANLMLTSQGVMKVLDFGIAKLDDAALTQTGLVVGTPMHMAPEQASDRKIDHRTDIFALGSVFYELFTREKPFKGDVTTVLYKIVHEDPVPPSVINPGLPSGIDAIIRKALAKEPRDRFQSCEEMGKAFQEQAASLTTTTTTLPTMTSEKPAVARPAPAPRPAPSTGSYLLETTTIRPRRSRRLPLTLVLLAAIGGTAGWAFYVKSQTGVFPPVVQKIVAVAQRAMPGHSTNGSAAEPDPSQPAKPASSQSTADAPAGLSAGSSTTGTPTTGTQTQTVNPETQRSPAAPSSSSAPSGEQSQPATSNAATPAAGEVNTGASTTTQPPATSTAKSHDDAETQTATAEDRAKAARKPAAREPVARVDGFTRHDVPELLRQADAAAGRSDYLLARYEYNLILKLEHGNAAARAGLLHIQTAEQR